VDAPATMEIRERAWRFRIAPHLAECRLDELTRDRLETWLARLVRAEPEHRRSVELALATLKRLLSGAVEWRRLPINPAAGLKMPAAPPSTPNSQRVLTSEQVDALLEHAPRLRDKTLVLAALDGALRRGELIGLRWENVKLAERRFVISEAVWQ